MRNIRLIAALAALAASVPAFGFSAGVSRAVSQTQHVDIVNALEELRSSVRVTGTGIVHTAYDGIYSVLDSDAEYSIDQIYGTIEETDGSETRAVRDLSQANPITYYEGENKNVWSDYLMPDNTVEKEEYLVLNMPETFARSYSNPWDFISERDISDTLELDAQKASLVINNYLDLDFAVSSATLSFDSEGRIDEIDFNCFDKPGQILVGTETVSTTQSLDVSFSFDYDVEPLTHLDPSTDSNPELATALSNMGDNYTAYFTGANFTSDAVYYVTDDIILLHQQASAKYLVDGDIAYTKTGANWDSFNYANGKWSAGTSSIPLDQILPRFGSVSDAIFDRVGESSTYALKAEATTYAADYLSAPSTLTYATENTGTVGSVTLADGHIQTASVAYELGATCTGSFTDYGTTALPSWFDSDALRAIM